jgi:hypothetical protein
VKLNPELQDVYEIAIELIRRTPADVLTSCLPVLAKHASPRTYFVWDVGDGRRRHLGPRPGVDES